MLTFICFSIALVLALRALLLAIFERRGWLACLTQCGFFLFFVLCSLLLLSEDLFQKLWPEKTIFFLTVSAITAPLLFLRLKRGPRHPFLKSLGLLIFLLFLFLILAFKGFISVQEDQPLARVTIPGIHSSSGYLVKLHSTKGELILESSVHGDLMGVRARTLRVKPLLSFFGVHTLCRIELLHSSYLTPERIELLPHSAQPLSFSHARKLPAFVEKFWEELFFEKASSFWIKSATIESTYFPLIDKKGMPFHGSFLLTLNASGLSSLAFSD
ncbi:MAG: hypothetical protein HYX48_04865 [Chlamydiales bacterium]|nr:hypothetical protein [Chlamydiales bacterium]